VQIAIATQHCRHLLLTYFRAILLIQAKFLGSTLSLKRVNVHTSNLIRSLDMISRNQSMYDQARVKFTVGLRHCTIVGPDLQPVVLYADYAMKFTF